MLANEIQERSQRAALSVFGSDHHQRNANGVGLDGSQDETVAAQIAHIRWNQGDALAGLDQRQDGLHHVGLVDYAWPEAGAAAEADDRIEEFRFPARTP